MIFLVPTMQNVSISDGCINARQKLFTVGRSIGIDVRSIPLSQLLSQLPRTRPPGLPHGRVQRDGGGSDLLWCGNLGGGEPTLQAAGRGRTPGASSETMK